MFQEENLQNEYEKFFSLSTDLLTISDSKGILLLINSSWEKLLGYSLNELQGTSFFSLIHPHDLDSTLAEFEEIKKGEQATTFENRYRAKDGQYIWLQWSSSYNVESEKIYAVAREMTEKKILSERLKEKDKNFDRALRASKMAIFNWNPKTAVIYWSDNISALFGIDMDCFDGSFTSYLNCIFEEDKQKVTEAAMRLLELGEDFHVEHRMKSSDNKIHWVICKGEAIRNEKGEVFNISGAILDVTERKLGELKVLQSEERYRSFIANSSEGIWRFELAQKVPVDLPPEDIVDQFFKYGYLAECNDVMAKMYGFEKAEEISNIPLSSFLLRSDPKNIEYLTAFIQSGFKLTNAESHEQDKDGNDKFFLNNLIGVVENGLIKRAWGTQQDITDKKRAELKLQEMNEELKKNNNELEQFAYVVSHDLRAPVANLLGLIKLFNKKDILAPINPKVLDKIEQSVLQLHGTLNELIELIALRKDKQQPKEHLDLQVVLDEVKSSIENKVKEYNASIRSEFSIPTVNFSIGVLKSVFLNLLTNSIKYSSTERPSEIYVKSYQDEDFTILEIKDNGIGIDLNRNKDKIFKMFQRFSPKEEGKGLGLYLVKNQVEAMGGKVEIESELGRGTTFKVFIR